MTSDFNCAVFLLLDAINPNRKPFGPPPLPLSQTFLKDLLTIRSAVSAPKSHKIWEGRGCFICCEAKHVEWSAC